MNTSNKIATGIFLVLAAFITIVNGAEAKKATMQGRFTVEEVNDIVKFNAECFVFSYHSRNFEEASRFRAKADHYTETHRDVITYEVGVATGTLTTYASAFNMSVYKTSKLLAEQFCKPKF